MNYLQQAAQSILIALHGYKTPKSVIDKLENKRQYKEQNYTENRKSIYANPPYNGKR
jgi:hypothetical protein